MEDPARVRDRSNRTWQEMIVPSVMLCVVGLYLYDTADLSGEALLFPLVLGSALLLALAISVGGHLLGRDAADHEDIGELSADPRPWLLAAGPAVLVAAIDVIGAIAVFFAIVFGAQVLLGARSILKSAALALAITLPTYLLFKQVLYVRFPAGLLGIG